MFVILISRPHVPNPSAAMSRRAFTHDTETDTNTHTRKKLYIAPPEKVLRP